MFLKYPHTSQVTSIEVNTLLFTAGIVQVSMTRSESRKIQFFHVGTSVRQCELCAALWRQMIKSMLCLSRDIHNHLRAVGETARVLN